MKKTFRASILLLFVVISCTSAANNEEPLMSDVKKNLDKYSVAYFASGCFWCVEAVFESVEGVEEAISGYAGGDAKTANYREVSSGSTKHAESVAVYYDPEVIDYQTLLTVFFDSHDPTTKNQQGPDRGPQYRSVIFYNNAQEQQLAKNYVRKLLDEKVFPKITTEIVPFEAFYPAEKYHQNYKKKNPNDPYVKGVSNPRLEKFKRKHPELLK
jgi:peptide-methionine (S)-S-oxide reductase